MKYIILIALLVLVAVVIKGQINFNRMLKQASKTGLGPGLPGAGLGGA